MIQFMNHELQGWAMKILSLSILLFIGGLIGAGTSALAQVVPGQTLPSNPLGIPQCAVVESSRRYLELEPGVLGYIEPDVLLESGGIALLAGFPNYRLAQEGPRGELADIQNTMLGVLIDPEWGVQQIPVPSHFRGREVFGVRAAALPNQRWAFLVPLLPPGETFPDGRRVGEIWFGIFGPSGWEFTERVPLPEGAMPILGGGSSLVRRGDTLSWLLHFSDIRGELRLQLLSRTEDGWKGEILPVSGVSGSDLFPDPKGGWLVAVTGNAPGDPSASVEVLSNPGSGWVSTRVSGPDGSHFSLPRFSTGGRALAWLSAPTPLAFHRAQMRATELSSSSESGYAILDGPTGGFFPIQLRMPFPTWVSAQPIDTIRSGFINFVGLNGADQFVLDSVPNSLGDLIQGITTEEGQILLAGADLGKVNRNEGLSTLILKFDVECTPPPSKNPQ